MVDPKLCGFLSSHSDSPPAVAIRIEPETIYLEPMRGRQWLNFDFALTNLIDRDLELRFLKLGVYDREQRLHTYRYANRNAVGPSGIDTTCTTHLPAGKTIDLFNPFHEFPGDLEIAALRYTFTFADTQSGTEFYYGDITVHPVFYHQSVDLRLPLRGLVTVLDGHDYLSHHRRFAMSLVREITHGDFAVNFNRYSVDLALVGDDGNLARMTPDEYAANSDFHFTNIRESYTDDAVVYAPADGEVVEMVNDLEDLYDDVFDTDLAIREGRIHEIAGNRIVLRHADAEYSHLFHLRKGSALVKKGERVVCGQQLARIGFSGTATVYSHLHYQLMSGPNFLTDEALPFEFTDIHLLRGNHTVDFSHTGLETGDFLAS